MNKPSAPFYDGPPLAAPPSYSQAMGGVPPSSPYVQEQAPKGPIIVTTVVPVGPYSTHMICTHCHREIETDTRTEPGYMAYVTGLIIAALGCWCGCCLIPCCMQSCMNVHHTCPNCKCYLGVYRR